MNRALRELRNWIRDGIVNPLIFSPLLPDPARRHVIQALGYHVGRSRVSSGGYFGGRRLRIGDGCFLARGVYIDASAPVWIGDSVQIGPGTALVTSTHRIAKEHARAGAATSGPITIGRGCWLGANVTVLPDVTIEAGVVVAAGSVVVQSCGANGLYAGVPARRIKDLP